MGELIDFNEHISEALGWLESAQAILFHFDLDCGGNFAEVKEAMKHFEAANKAVEAIREPLKSHIETAINLDLELE